MAAVPGRVTSSVARGSNRLIRDGAVPILETVDVLDELFGVGAGARAARTPADPGLQTVLEAAETTSSVSAIAETTGLDHRRGPGRPGPARGRRLPRPGRARRLGAGGVVRQRSGGPPADPRPPDPRRRLGALGEGLAARHLEALGFEIVDRNFRTRHGELDVIARDAVHLVFCEVKTRVIRGSPGPLGPFASIGSEKRRRVRAMAAEWFQTADLPGPRPPEIRFDAIGVSFDRAGNLTALDHLEAAF